MGQGTSSICYRGTVTKSGEEVAIKFYKDQSAAGKAKRIQLRKFVHQVEVLSELQEPFRPPDDPSLWNEHLAGVEPSSIFVRLLDYSKNLHGKPGPDAADGLLYVVTELGQYSLKEFLQQQRQTSWPLSREVVQVFSKSILLAMAGFHAKGFVHFDMKPENLMMFGGRWKIIDVDGCLRMRTDVNLDNSFVSFSPLYCAPEWARFLAHSGESRITASASLDAWSVGMTLCELVSSRPIMKRQYYSIRRSVSSNENPTLLFFDWLACVDACALPESIYTFDPAFVDLISNGLLVGSVGQRRSCAQCLLNPFIVGASSDNAALQQICPEAAQSTTIVSLGDPCERVERALLHKGLLWKLKVGGDPKDPLHWFERDMWISGNHQLCYYSVKNNEVTAILKREDLVNAQICKISDSSHDHAFTVQFYSAAEGFTNLQHFAANSQEELAQWVDNISELCHGSVKTLHLGGGAADNMKELKMLVKNRRRKIDRDTRDQCKPTLLQDRLWKVKSAGMKTKSEDWVERNMWLAENGSLVYWSAKEERELVYYTTADLAQAIVVPVAGGESVKPHCFSVVLPVHGGVEFVPGEFAAPSEKKRDRWITELRKLSVSAS
jgi:serine/threonine protein kinase